MNRVLHPKVKWAAAGSLLAAILTAVLGSVGDSLNPTLAALLTAVAAFIGGYRAPAAPVQDPEAPNA